MKIICLGCLLSPLSGIAKPIFTITANAPTIIIGQGGASTASFTVTSTTTFSDHITYLTNVSPNVVGTSVSTLSTCGSSVQKEIPCTLYITLQAGQTSGNVTIQPKVCYFYHTCSTGGSVTVAVQNINPLARVAVGFYNGTSGMLPLSYTSSTGGTNWQLSESLPLPTNLDGSILSLNSVTCGSTGMQCAAVGVYSYASSGHNHSLSYISTTGGASWQLSPLPIDQINNNNDYNLNGVACDSRGMQCTAVGNYYTSGNNSRPLAYTSINGGATWQPSTTLTLPSTNTSYQYWLNSVACDSTGLQCTAVGYYIDYNSKYILLTYTSTSGGAIWELSSQEPTTPSVYEQKFSSVACDSTGMRCTVVGFYNDTSGDTVPLIYTSTTGGAIWKSATLLPLPSGSNMALNGVACDSTGTQCAAVGDYNDTSGDTVPLSYTSTTGGASWQLSSLPLLSGSSIVLNSVTCDSTGMQCAAVGDYNDTSGDTVPLSYTSTTGGASWQLSSTLPLAPNQLTGFIDNELRGASGSK